MQNTSLKLVHMRRYVVATTHVLTLGKIQLLDGNT